jgi:hypothetical protein
VSITFDRSLYELDAVEAAAAAYAGYAEITVVPSGDAVIAEVTGVADDDMQRVANAFCNLALQETIVRMRRTTAPHRD